MDDEDREASPEPSSSHLCENSIDGYLSGEGPSASGVIDSSQLFSDTFDEEEGFVESQSKSPLHSSDYGLIPFERSYNYSEDVMTCQVGQSNFCERSDVYSSPSHSKPNHHDFNSMDIDDNQPGSSSGNFPSSQCERQDFQGSSSSRFEPNSNEDGSNLHYKLGYPLSFHKKSPEQTINLNASSSKQADSSLFDKNKEYGKNKVSKGKGKGKGKSSKQYFPFKLTGSKSSPKQRENKVDSSNKHSLFANHSPNPSNSLRSQIRRPTMSDTLDIDNEDSIEEEDPVNTSSQCEFLCQRDIQVLNENDAYMVASSSEGVNGMHHLLDIKSPTTPSDNCLVSSSTGQLDSLPPTPINFQGNDASHSSPASSPISNLNPPVLDSTVDSTSGQNLSYCDEEEEENEDETRSENDLEFPCSLDEDRNEISTSVSHVQHGIDSQELNLLVGSQGVFGEQQSNEGQHFVGSFLSLDNLHSSSLHSTLTDDKSNDETESALVPTSSAYISDSLEMPGSSHMSEVSKRLLYRRRKVPSYNSLDANNSSLGTSALPLNNINPISFSEENALNTCHSEGALSPVGLIELDISEMEPESSSLVASSANIDGDEYPATSASALSPSESNFESNSTLAQLNQPYLLSSGDNSLSSEDGLSTHPVSQAGPELNESSLGLNGQLREKDDSLGSASDNEGTSNFHASLELGLGPQQLRCLSGSQQEPEPQSLVPPPHLLEETNNTDSSTNMGLLECSLVGSVQSSNAACSESNLNKVNQVSPCLKSETTSSISKNPFVIMVSEAEEVIPSHFPSLNAGPSSTGDEGKKKCLGLISPTKAFLDDSAALNLSAEPMCPLNMESSSSYVGSIGAKENINRIPNGVFKFWNSGSFEKLPPIKAEGSPSDEEGSDSVSHILLPNEISPVKNVPINIHSLFGHRPSILKPSSTKSLSSHSVIHNSKDHSLLNSSVKEVSFSDACQSSSNFEPSPPSELFSRSLSIESNEVELHKNEEPCLSQKLAHANQVKDIQLYNCDADVTNVGPSCSEFSQSNHEIHSNTTSASFENMVQPSVESVNEGNNGFWCADCEKFLEAKCSLHRIQTIMDKPVLTRAWASLPAQHLTIKAVSPENGGCKGLTYGVFTRKAIPKRTQFGPLEGVFSKVPPPLFGQLFKTMQNNVEGFFDISEEGSSNWMRFVRAAEMYTQMNCVVIEEENLIYFLTTANLPSKTELRVGYSKQYAVKYNLPLLVPTEEEKDLLQKNLTCNSCNISFSSSPELEEHLSAHKGSNNRERRPKRKVRPKGFKQSSPQPQRLLKRVKVNKRTAGDKNETDFSTGTKKSDKDSYDCMFCELSFRQPEILRLHSLGHPPFPSTAQEDEAGVNSECSSKPYTEVRICPACSKRSKSLQEIIDHTKEHSFLSPKASSEPRMYKCELCFKSFSNLERLVSHSEVHKGDVKKPPYSCYLCLRRFCNKSALASHLKLHLECDGAKVYDCPICQEKFYGIASLKTHLPSHCINGEYTCPTCSKKFSSYHKIRRHIRSYHSAVHPCLQCGKNLPSLQKLKVHLVSHSDRRDFACLVCQKCFKRKDKMKEHFKRIHSVKREPNNNNNGHTTFNNRKKNNQKFVPKVDPSDYKQFIYKCDLCLLGFKRRGMLVNHLSKRHPNIPLSSIPELNQPILRTSHSYICQYCGKSYVSSTKRKLHILKNHPGAEVPPSCASMGEEGSKTTRTYPASCPWCPRQYATKAKLLQHQRYHHGINKEQAPESEVKNVQEAPKAKEREELEAEATKPPQEDLLTQALGRISGKTQFVRMVAEGVSPSMELRIQHEGEELDASVDRSKTSPSSAPTGDQVLVSPSFILPNEGTSYALLTPDGADSFTLSLRPGQIIPTVGSFSVLSASDTPSTTESSNPGPSRLLPIDSVSHQQFALDLNGMKGESCVVAQVGAESPSPVLVWQPSLSFTPSS